MCVSLVGLGGLVHIVSSLDGSASAVGSIDDFAGKLVGHGLLVSQSGISDKPSEAESDLSLGGDFDRDLIVAGADSSGLQFDLRHDVAEGDLENFESRLSGLGLDLVESTIEDGLGDALLSVEHDSVDDARAALLLYKKHRSEWESSLKKEKHSSKSKQ